MKGLLKRFFSFKKEKQGKSVRYEAGENETCAYAVILDSKGNEISRIKILLFPENFFEM